MLNYIWGFMIIIGTVFGFLTGSINEVGNGSLQGAKEAVTLCITMLGVMSMWTGLMEIARQAGIMEKMTKALMPVIRFLFPDIPKGHIVQEYIASNMMANILGLGWAATPMGLKAMKELKTLNNNSRMASVDMCTFLIINISSLQLIPVNIIAYRSQYGSVNPSQILLTAILATIISTIVGVIYSMLARKAVLKKAKRHNF